MGTPKVAVKYDSKIYKILEKERKTEVLAGVVMINVVSVKSKVEIPCRAYLKLPPDESSYVFSIE